jgi:hypothetical protein
MTLHFRTIIVSLATCATVGLAVSRSQAADILRLNLGEITVGYGVFGTGSDGDATTLGNQNTDVEFTGFLDGLFTDITTTDASFSCCGTVLASPTATSTNGNILVYGFSDPSGGMLSSFSLYAPDNTLLLSGQVGGGTLTGPMGPPATGEFVTTTLQSVTGGTLAPYLEPNSISLRFDLTNVRHSPIPLPGYLGDPSGQGFALYFPEGTDLLPFTADAIVTIAANPIPEPATVGLILPGAVAAAGLRRRRASAAPAGNTPERRRIGDHAKSNAVI